MLPRHAGALEFDNAITRRAPVATKGTTAAPWRDSTPTGPNYIHTLRARRGTMRWRSLPGDHAAARRALRSRQRLHSPAGGGTRW